MKNAQIVLWVKIVNGSILVTVLPICFFNRLRFECIFRLIKLTEFELKLSKYKQVWIHAYMGPLFQLQPTLGDQKLDFWRRPIRTRFSQGKEIVWLLFSLDSPSLNLKISTLTKEILYLLGLLKKTCSIKVYSA